MINSEYEYIALHRDVGETELKQVGNCLIVGRWLLTLLWTFKGKGDQERREFGLRGQPCSERS
jgi:hypothetical protein